MSSYYLLQNVTAQQSAPTPTAPPVKPVQPWGPTNPTSPPQSQSFEAVLQGIGSCSATIQVVASNDGDNWAAFGPAQTVTAAQADLTPGVALWTAGLAPYRHFGAYVTAISGTGASVSCRMNA